MKCPRQSALRIQEELREAILAGTLEPGTRVRAEALREAVCLADTRARSLDAGSA